MLLQQDCGCMHPEYMFVLLRSLMPRSLEKELTRRTREDVHNAIDIAAETLARLNGDGLAAFEERSIQQSAGQARDSLHLHGWPRSTAAASAGSATTAAAAAIPCTTRGCRPASSSTGRSQTWHRKWRTTTRQRTAGHIPPSQWKGGACFECGQSSHRRYDCPESIRRNALPGGYPADHKNERQTYRKAGYKKKKDARAATQRLAASLPSPAGPSNATSADAVQGIVKTWAAPAAREQQPHMCNACVHYTNNNTTDDETTCHMSTNGIELVTA